jgi:hypothetical protein
MNEPSMSLDEVKKKLSAAPGPRVTEETIKSKISGVVYIEHNQMTICLITMQNGFISDGVSKPASRDNFDAEIGKRYAYENAFRALWRLEGYLLLESLSANERSPRITDC